MENVLDFKYLEFKKYLTYCFLTNIIFFNLYEY